MLVWYQWLTVLGVPSLISGLFMLAITRKLNRRDEARREEEQQKEEDRRKAEKERADRDKLMIEQNAVVEAQNNALMLGLQAVLRDRLLTGYKHYRAKGWADYDDRMNLENVYTQYHALGANGVMDGMRESFLGLPDADPNANE